MHAVVALQALAQHGRNNRSEVYPEAGGLSRKLVDDGRHDSDRPRAAGRVVAAGRWREGFGGRKGPDTDSRPPSRCRLVYTSATFAELAPDPARYEITLLNSGFLLAEN